MPKYKVTDPVSGQTLTLSGDSPPTEAELEQVFAQYASSAAPPPSPPPTRGQHPLATLGDVGIGAGKGLINTVIGAGEAAYDFMPGISTVSDAVAGGDAKPMFAAARAMVQPTTTAQRVGYTGEQVGEFFTPLPGSKLKAAKEVLRAGLLTQAQTASLGTAGVSAGLTAAIPGAGKVAGTVAGALKKSANKSVAQALGATKEWAKSDAAKLAPEMLHRGVRGSRESMKAMADEASAEAGQRLGVLYQTAGASGQTVSGLAIRGELQLVRDSLMVPGRNGTLVPIPGTESVLQALTRLEKGLEKIGDDIPVHHAAAIKTAWDKIVSKAGLYGQKAGASATDNAEAWAMREGTDAVRTALHSANPEIATLSKEYAFWKRLRDVLKATELRTQAQSGGLQAAIGATTGGVSGAMSSDSVGQSVINAFAGAAAGRQFVKLVQSPWWRTSVSGPLKDKMANALMSGNTGQTMSAWSQVLAALPSQARQALQ